MKSLSLTVSLIHGNTNADWTVEGVGGGALWLGSLMIPFYMAIKIFGQPQKKNFPNLQQLYMVTNRSTIPKVTKSPVQVATYELTFNPTDGGLHMCLLNGQSQEGLKKHE